MHKKVVTDDFTKTIKEWKDDIEECRVFNFIIGLSCGDPGDFDDSIYLDAFLHDHPDITPHIVERCKWCIVLDDLDAAETVSEFLSNPYTVTVSLFGGNILYSENKDICEEVD